MDCWEKPKLYELVKFVIGGDWGKEPSITDDNYVDVYCIRGTELRNWDKEYGKTAAHRKIKRSSLEKRRLKEGDLIVEVSGGGPEQPVGRVEYISTQVLLQNSDRPKVCTNFFRRIELKSEVESRYIAMYLKYFYLTGKIVKYQSGSNNLRNLNYSDYEQIHIPYPPLNEQRRIVEKIEILFAQLDAGEAALRQAQEQLARYRQSVLKAAVTGALTADWRAQNAHRLEHGRDLLARILQARRENWQGRGKYKEPAAPDISDLPELPQGWVWASIEQLGEVMGGLTKNSKRGSLPFRRPMLRVANVYQNRLDLSDIHDIGLSEAELSRVSLEDGDILVVEGNGSKSQIGRMAIWRNEIPEAIHQNHLIKIRMHEKWMANIVLIWFQSPYGRQKIEQVASSTSGLYTLSISKINSLVIPIAPMEEIEKIGDLVDEFFSISNGLDLEICAELTRSAALRQSILKDAFSGKLVPQDPDDEPASALLARIRAGRVQQAAPSTARKRGRKPATIKDASHEQ